jgi:hypothetical protein
MIYRIVLFTGLSLLALFAICFFFTKHLGLRELRASADSVLLKDGRIFIIGGTRYYDTTLWERINNVITNRISALYR